MLQLAQDKTIGLLKIHGEPHGDLQDMFTLAKATALQLMESVVLP